jgi:hypothetical protein
MKILFLIGCYLLLAFLTFAPAMFSSIVSREEERSSSDGKVSGQ